LIATGAFLFLFFIFYFYFCFFVLFFCFVFCFVLIKYSSTKRELEAVKQKRETSEVLLAQLKNEAKNLEEMVSKRVTLIQTNAF
jgi:predicted membrane protein